MNPQNTPLTVDTTHVPPILDLNQIKEALRVLNVSLNKGAKGGVYTIDEAYVIKISISHIEKTVEVFEQYQNNHVNDKDKQTTNS